MLKLRENPLDDAFRALADPTRRAIVERLSRGRASVSELAAPLPMSLPAVQQHLQVLADSGLIEWEKEGRVRWCRLGTARLHAVERWILARRTMWQRRLDALAVHLEQEKRKGKKSHERAKRSP